MGPRAFALAMSLVLLASAVALAARERARANAQENPSKHSSPASVSQQREQQLALACQLLSETEHSPSANPEELRDKLRQARAATQAVLEANSQDAEALDLSARIEALLAALAPRRHDDHPWTAEAEATLDRLTALVKGGGPRHQVEDLHTHLRRLARRLETANPAGAARYQQRAQVLWALYASRLAWVEDVCPGCPTLDVAALAKGFSRARLLGAGDYALEDLEKMPADTATQKPAHTPLLTGDFNHDGAMDVALIGRGKQKGKEKLFVLIASVQEGGYRRLFLLPLDWDKAALAHGKGEGVRAGTVILSNIFEPTDDFWTLRWNGQTFVLRYFGEEMDPECGQRRVLDLECAEKLKAGGTSPEKPSATITVPAVCADVWDKVFSGFDPSRKVTSLDRRPEDERLPLAGVRDAFLMSVPGLNEAAAPMDALD